MMPASTLCDLLARLFASLIGENIAAKKLSRRHRCLQDLDCVISQRGFPNQCFIKKTLEIATHAKALFLNAKCVFGALAGFRSWEMPKVRAKKNKLETQHQKSISR